MSTCSLCNGKGYHENGCSLKCRYSGITSGDVTLELNTEVFPGAILLDTGVEIKCKPFCISYKDRLKLANELDEVISRYKI